MSRFLTGITEDLNKEWRAAMLHDNMTFRGLWSMSSKWRKEEYTRPENRSRKSEENFSRKSSTKIRDKPRFKKGIFHQGESSESKGLHDRYSESRVKRNNEVDTL